MNAFFYKMMRDYTPENK